MQVLNEGYSGGRFATNSQGQYIWINGKKLLDFALCGGTHIFGHSPRFIRKAIKHQLKLGTGYATPNTLAFKYAEEFRRHVPLDSMVFCNSGSEAVMRAFRIARANTGRKKVVILHGFWHGSYDGTVSHNYPLGCIDDETVVLPYDESLKKVLETLAGQIAMIFVEPFQGSNPQNRSNLIQFFRDYCDRTGTLLGFDEIISGFRTPGIDHYGIVPDLATYGKIAGGGFPIGIVAGKSPVMDVIKSGVFMGGTFSGNPMSLTAGLEVIRRINPQVINRLNEMAIVLKNRVRDCQYLSIMGVGSFLRLMFMKENPRNCSDRDKKELSGEIESEVCESLFKSGIFIGRNELIFLSTCHTESNINYLAESIIYADSNIH